jgi:hypothetical protein
MSQENVEVLRNRPMHRRLPGVDCAELTHSRDRGG